MYNILLHDTVLDSLSSLSYLERQFVTNLPSLEITRLRYDCISLYNTLQDNLYSSNYNFVTYRSDAIGRY